MVLIIVYAISTLLIFIGTILACVNIGKISKGSKIDIGSNIFSSLLSLNIAIVCINFALIIIIVIFCIYLFITPKYLSDQDNVTQYKTIKDNNIEFKDIKNKDSGYSSSNFNNNNNYYNSGNYNNYNNNNYYNSNGYNNNLVPNYPQ